MLHRASCTTITRRALFTGPYIKVCSSSLAQLDEWAQARNGTPAPRCGICQPAPADTSPAAVADASPARLAEATPKQRAQPVAVRDHVDRSPWRAEGPAADSPEVWL
jgi:hypothetical protein